METRGCEPRPREPINPAAHRGRPRGTSRAATRCSSAFGGRSPPRGVSDPHSAARRRTFELLKGSEVGPLTFELRRSPSPCDRSASAPAPSTSPPSALPAPPSRASTSGPALRDALHCAAAVRFVTPWAPCRPALRDALRCDHERARGTRTPRLAPLPRTHPARADTRQHSHVSLDLQGRLLPPRRGRSPGAEARRPLTRGSCRRLGGRRRGDR